MNKYSSVDKEMGYGLDDRGAIPGTGKELFSFQSVQNGSGGHRATQWVPRVVSLRKKRPERKLTI
jgi:hypothetical protein